MHSLQLTPSNLKICKDSLFENDSGNQFEDAIKETMGIPYHWEEHIIIGHHCEHWEHTISSARL